MARVFVDELPYTGKIQVAARLGVAARLRRGLAPEAAGAETRAQLAGAIAADVPDLHDQESLCAFAAAEVEAALAHPERVRAVEVCRACGRVVPPARPGGPDGA